MQWSSSTRKGGGNDTPLRKEEIDQKEEVGRQEADSPENGGEEKVDREEEVGRQEVDTQGGEEEVDRKEVDRKEVDRQEEVGREEVIP